MTADERIEQLLRHFGETIEDLPKHTETHYAYKFATRNKAILTVRDWGGEKYFNTEVLGDYICHLSDIVDRMENALMTAHRLLSTQILSCEHCLYDESGCFKHCEEVDYVYCFDVRDEALAGGDGIEEDEHN